MRAKLCRQCKEPFVPQGGQPWQRILCKYECASLWGREESNRRKEKAARADTKQRKAALESLPSLLKKCQISFNKYVNTRDAELPCIACNEPIRTVAHASHYLSVGARPNLRFSEMNVHKGCSKCNLFLHGNLINFRLNLIKRVGLEAVEALESDQTPKHYTKDQLIALAKEYRRRTRELIKQSDVDGR